jgi:hypothetical protein
VGAGDKNEPSEDGYPARIDLPQKFWQVLRTSHTIEAMARSVTISTPIPTLEEFGKSLGLSKKRQDSLLRLVHREPKAGQLIKRGQDTSKEKGTGFRTKK